jgi:DNA-binding transcriptional MerR regulator
MQMDKDKPAEPSRRVYSAELKRRMKIGSTWLRELERRGLIPPGRTDPGGRRKFWYDFEADQIIKGRT